MFTSSLILVTRRSALAWQQSSWVKSQLEQRIPGLRVELLGIGTAGDRMRDRPLPQIGGKGLFTQELEEALISKRAHFAVHSLKDLPTELGEGLTLAAVPPREDPRDVLISKSKARFFELPKGAGLGTSSVRRAAQLLHQRPDLSIEPMRGNLDTRLRKLRDGPLDAIVLAAAGLHRMGWQDRITEYLPDSVMFPAVGQGALGIEACAGDASTLELLSVLDDPWTRIATTAERALLRHLGGGCQVPIAAHACRDGEGMRLSGVVLRPDGSERIHATEREETMSIRAAETIGMATAENLLRQGARRLLAANS